MVGKELVDLTGEGRDDGGEEEGGGDDAAEGVDDEGDEEWSYCDRSECGMCDDNGKMNLSKIREYLRHEPACRSAECARCRARKCRGCSYGILRQDMDLNLCGRWT